MKGYRDRNLAGPHTLTIDRVPCVFGADGVLWEPTAIQEQVLGKDHVRKARFEEIESLGKAPDAVEPVAGEDLETALTGRRRRRATEPTSEDEPTE